jgi:DNA-binding protein HU-beta
MNKTELVEEVARDAGLAKADAARALDSLLGTVERTLQDGEEVAITGFGKFSVSDRSARTGRNPQTGETIEIKASKTPKFFAGASLKQAVNEAPGR